MFYYICHMFSNTMNYVIASYILIIPSIILLVLLNHFMDKEVQIAFGEELFGMALLAPLGFPFVVLMLALLLFVYSLSGIIQILGLICGGCNAFATFCDKVERIFNANR